MMRNSVVYSVNMTNGLHNYITLSTNVYRITTRTDGSLVGLTGSQLVKINTSTGAVSVLGNAQIRCFGASDATYQNIWYVLGSEVPGGATLVYKVNVAMGIVSNVQLDIEPLSIGIRADGSLVGLTGTGVRLVDTNNGTTTLLSSLSIDAFCLSETTLGNSMYLFGARGPGGNNAIYKINMLSGTAVSASITSALMMIAMEKTASEQPTQPVIQVSAPAVSSFGVVLLFLALPVIGFFAIRKKNSIVNLFLTFVTHFKI